MLEYPTSFPADYRQLIMPSGWKLSSRVVQPEVRISKADWGFTATLAGSRTVRGEKTFWNALSPFHNWVIDGNVIRPLPHDTPDVLRAMLGGEVPSALSFPDVIRLLRLKNPDIPVDADDSVFLPARSAAGRYLLTRKYQGFTQIYFRIRLRVLPGC